MPVPLETYIDESRSSCEKSLNVSMAFAFGRAGAPIDPQQSLSFLRQAYALASGQSDQAVDQVVNLADSLILKADDLATEFNDPETRRAIIIRLLQETADEYRTRHRASLLRRNEESDAQSGGWDMPIGVSG